MKVFGGIEAGGTKFICGIGTGPHDLETIRFPTTTPQETMDQAIGWFRAKPRVEAIGIAAFGPVDLNPASQTYGYITTTPKQGWQSYGIARAVQRALNVPVAIDTDVNGAAIGEGRWGAAQGLANFMYLTIGTGIGGGAVIGNKIVHGMMHPEMGHIRIPHDVAEDPYKGCCAYHGDCLEGLASGPAMEARWGTKAINLPANHIAWRIEATYLALALNNWVCTLSPQRILLGGGVMQQPHLFEMIRTQLAKLLNNYIQTPELTTKLNEYVVPPKLGAHAGVLGALALAIEAADSK